MTCSVIRCTPWGSAYPGLRGPSRAGGRLSRLIGDHRPEGDPALARLIAELEDDPLDPLGARIALANQHAIDVILSARPRLVDVQPAARAIPGLGQTLLHAGPPIRWDRMCGPMRGAVIGAILYEGWAATPAEAERLAASDDVAFAPCHDFGAVGPMAGVVSPSMPVAIVENAAHGNRAFATLNEGLGRVLRFGAYDEETLERLRWIGSTLGPALSAALRASGPIDLHTIIAQALLMGDECHNRNAAATGLLTRKLAPALVRATPPDTAAATLEFLAGNDHFFLNLSMAACKATMDAVPRDGPATIVTAMARNGVDFGIRVAATGDRWFTAPASPPAGLFFPGYGPADANPDLGDSAITETAGLGGFAMAAAPAIVRFVGGTTADALHYTVEMGEITLARNPNFALAPMEFAGTPTGIDVRRVVETGVTPVINTGIAHRQAGVGQIGAGVARAPMECFIAAIRAFAELAWPRSAFGV